MGVVGHSEYSLPVHFCLPHLDLLLPHIVPVVSRLKRLPGDRAPLPFSAQVFHTSSRPKVGASCAVSLEVFLLSVIPPPLFLLPFVDTFS